MVFEKGEKVFLVLRPCRLRSCCAIYFHFGNRTITSDDRFSCGRLCAQCGMKSPDSNLDKNCRNTYAFQFLRKRNGIFDARIANGTTSTSNAHTWRRRRIDAGDEHTICHDELSVASIINFSWHMRSAAATSNDVDDIGIFPCTSFSKRFRNTKTTKKNTICGKILS